MNNYVKITSGEYRGRKITTPGGKTHPMGERERLALFNMISGYLPGASVLDAFAGSGALGIEALSRGAKRVTFIEKNAEACKLISKNLKELGIPASQTEIQKEDIYKALEAETNQWRIVLADPPYDDYDQEKVRQLADMVGKPGGILVLSHPGAAPEMDGLILQKSKKYAGATISVYVNG